MHGKTYGNYCKVPYTTYIDRCVMLKYAFANKLSCFSASLVHTYNTWLVVVGMTKRRPGRQMVQQVGGRQSGTCK